MYEISPDNVAMSIWLNAITGVLLSVLLPLGAEVLARFMENSTDNSERR
jgi:hypothetical protein